ncbi:ArsR/SmtB family transcription factor [Silvimonas amylolytica]|uniref:Transcriptional regulator n=1 Tax=Silvimonas amylolytica TaxID=449663 RepID=A0ABQ2PRD7_9NEIS|nr:helix-turn-helix transcriptional regulator [Silvimonas amylolytica]GGP28159.1 transcriptional regulator [Silvimonas amylolytica]
MDEAHLEQRLANLAAAVADKTRAGMLCMLMDGRAYTATELAAATSVAASTASSHLARLTQQSLVECLPQGRHRYFRIASKEVASALETLMGLVGGRMSSVRSSAPQHLRFARTCYDHMAGEVAVALHDRLFDLGWLAPDSYQLAESGRQALMDLGVEWPSVSRRRFACGCLDWSERQSHLGGQLGAALLRGFEQHHWVERVPESRQLLLTQRGHKALAAQFGLVFSVSQA